MSMETYRSAVKLGQKEYRTRVSQGRSPYPQVLDDLLRFTEIQGEEALGLVSVPMSHIVGTRSAGRSNAFTAGFLPLLDPSTEFAAKWSALADSHLAEGIREPITAVEYLNRFYVQEGNKRVSVLKFYGAVAVPAVVRRLLPRRQDDLENRLYFEFLDFYGATKVNSVWFSQPGRFKLLLGAVHGGDGPWTDGERSAFLSVYARFRRVFKAMGGDRLPGTTGDAFLAYLRLHDLEQLHAATDQQLRDGLGKSWQELAAFSVPEPVELALDPEAAAPSLLTRLHIPKPELHIPTIPRPEPLRAAFLYERSPDASAWANAHEEGRRFAEEALEGRVVTTCFSNAAPGPAAEAALQQAADSSDVVFATSPKLLPACLKTAAKYPNVKLLNCSVYSPHPSIRCYYGRMFEVKFLVGLVAGALSQSHRIGYIADYPIYGAVAAVNAFALGARMTDPGARVFLEWRAQSGAAAWDRLLYHGVDVIAGQDLHSPVDPWRAHGLYTVSGGVGQQLGAWRWNWGRFYQRILTQILDGSWKPSPDRDAPKAINYWWGLSAGVVDFNFSDRIPADTLRLAHLMRDEIAAGRFRPFELPPEEIVRMADLAENVSGGIPALEELTDEARQLVRLQGVRKEDREGTI